MRCVKKVWPLANSAGGSTRSLTRPLSATSSVGVSGVSQGLLDPAAPWPGARTMPSRSRTLKWLWSFILTWLSSSMLRTMSSCHRFMNASASGRPDLTYITPVLNSLSMGWQPRNMQSEVTAMSTPGASTLADSHGRGSSSHTTSQSLTSTSRPSARRTLTKSALTAPNRLKAILSMRKPSWPPRCSHRPSTRRAGYPLALHASSVAVSSAPTSTEEAKSASPSTPRTFSTQFSRKSYRSYDANVSTASRGRPPPGAPRASASGPPPAP
mmetsp:Transcript_5394/g.18759  ORF Transcript_5394/g.18759 Transcript_5394/m.18759 type:complete len:269 (-) Transcript_5394:8-814(-)